MGPRLPRWIPQRSGPCVTSLTGRKAGLAHAPCPCVSTHLGYLTTGRGSTQLFLGLTLPHCPVALVALSSVPPQTSSSFTSPWWKAFPGSSLKLCRSQDGHADVRGHPPYQLDTSETHTQAWVWSTSSQTLILRMKAEATHTLSLGTAPSAPPSALSPGPTCGPSGAWSYPDPRIPGTGVAIFRLFARRREILRVRTSWLCSLSYSGKEATAKTGRVTGTRQLGLPRTLLRDALAEGWTRLLFLWCSCRPGPGHLAG